MTTAIVQRDTKGPETLGPLAVGPALGIILGPVDLLKFDKKTFTVKNAGAVAFNACKVQATVVEGSPGVASAVDADWEDIDTTTLQTLAASAVKSVQIKDDSRKWWRVIASVASTATSAQAWLTAGAV